MITKFEKYNKDVEKPDLSKVNKEFWEMVDLVDWKTIMDYYKENPVIEDGQEPYENASALKLYVKYSYEQIERFYKIYEFIYWKLYDYFLDYLNISPDDEIDCVIDCIIGLGKSYLELCINKPSIVKNMLKNTNYIEGFKNLLNVTEEEYWEIKVKDPFYKDIRSFNV